MDQVLQEWYSRNEDGVRKLAHDIWEHPEIGMQEHYTSARVASYLEEQGFSVKLLDVRHPDEKDAKPNAVIAKVGEGSPVIAVLGELDALMGLGNENVPYHAPIEGCGHGCGHNLIVSCGAAAASALKYTLEKEGLKGTLMFFGCPAEENLHGKAWLAKWGYFDHVDVALMWHPGGRPMRFSGHRSLCVTSMLFEFTGVPAHGLYAWNGRSALDACELMNVGVNYLREHVTQDCAMHYVYQEAGGMPNVVPEHASVHYYIRSTDENNEKLVERVIKVAEGASLMTETELKITKLSHCWGEYPTISLNRYVEQEAEKIPPLTYAPEDYQFVRELHKDFFGDLIEEDTEELLPTKIRKTENWEDIPLARGSSDIGDVQNILPTIQIGGLGEMAGSPPHHWTITAAAGTAIGEKAAIYASKVIAQSALDLFKNPELVDGFWEDFRTSRKRDGIKDYVKLSL